MSVKERLIKYLKSKKVSYTNFGKVIGVSNAYVTSIRKSIDIDKIQSIALNYPDLNIDWLLTGQGNMLKESNTVTQSIVGDNNQLAGNRIKNTSEYKSMTELIKDLKKQINQKDSIINNLIKQQEMLLKQINKLTK